LEALSRGISFAESRFYRFSFSIQTIRTVFSLLFQVLVPTIGKGPISQESSDSFRLLCGGKEPGKQYRYFHHQKIRRFLVQNPDLLNLPGWQVIACEESEDCYVIQARPCSPRVPCPSCGSSRAFGHGRDFQKLHDLPCHGKHVTIHLDRRRYCCADCRKTWVEELPQTDEQRRATTRLVRYVQRQALTRTFVAVAAETGLDEKTARNWFADSIAELQHATPLPTPRIMGLDEIYLLGQPRAVFTDLETHRIVEILPERKKEYLGRYFAALAGKEALSVVVIDMHRPYLDLVQEYIPQAQIVIDKFHVLCQLKDVVERGRKEVRAELSDRQRRTLMHDRFLLHKHRESLTAQQLLILESWLGQFPRLAAIYWLKQDFYKVYEARTYEEAITHMLCQVVPISGREPGSLRLRGVLANGGAVEGVDFQLLSLSLYGRAG